MGKSALYLWCAGLAIVTFDLVLRFNFLGFTIKSYYFLFLAAASLFAFAEIKAGRLLDEMKQLFRAPWVFAFLLFLYELGMSPFSFAPKKSYGYSCFLLFDLLVVAIPGVAILRRNPVASRKAVTIALMTAAYFLVSVILVDLVAFQYGVIGGLIGYNQELSLMWGMSRAHAFSYEPSYLSMYFNFSLLFLTGEFLSPNRVVSRKPLCGAISLLLVGIFLLASRTGWVLVAIGLLVLLFQSRRLLWRRELALPSGAILAGLLLFLCVLPKKHYSAMTEHLISTILSGTDGSGNSRLKAMTDAINIGIETKGLGVGVGASFFYYIAKHPEVVTPYLNVSMSSEYIMSIWGQIVAESGLPGFLLYLAFGLSVIWATISNSRKNEDATVNACAISAVLFFVFAAHLVGNLARTDVWVWFVIWMVFGAKVIKPVKADV
ncbi:MAG: O-antigen ligase family protein [Bdellovibrionota bacterium]